LPPDVELKMFEPTWKDEHIKKNPKDATADNQSNEIVQRLKSRFLTKN